MAVFLVKTMKRVVTLEKGYHSGELCICVRVPDVVPMAMLCSCAATTTPSRVRVVSVCGADLRLLIKNENMDVFSCTRPQHQRRQPDALFSLLRLLTCRCRPDEQICAAGLGSLSISLCILDGLQTSIVLNRSNQPHGPPQHGIHLCTRVPLYDLGFGLQAARAHPCSAHAGVEVSQHQWYWSLSVTNSVIVFFCTVPLLFATNVDSMPQTSLRQSMFLSITPCLYRNVATLSTLHQQPGWQPWRAK